MRRLLFWPCTLLLGVSALAGAQIRDPKANQTILKARVIGNALVSVYLNDRLVPPGRINGFDWQDVSALVRYGTNRVRFTYSEPAYVQISVSFAEQPGRFRNVQKFSTDGLSRRELAATRAQTFSFNLPDPRSAGKASAGSASRQVWMRIGSAYPVKVYLNDRYVGEVSRQLNAGLDVTPFTRQGNNQLVLKGSRKEGGVVVKVLYEPVRNQFRELFSRIEYPDPTSGLIDTRAVFTRP